VLLLFQQQAETQPMVEFTQRLRATVQRELASPLEFYQEALDLDRFSSRERAKPLERYFADKYRGFGIDVVVPVGTRALRFAIDHLSEVFPEAPVVFALGTVPPIEASSLPEHVTGRVAEPSRFAPTLSLARALQPDAERVVIVAGLAATDSVSLAAAVGAAAAFGDTLQRIVLQGLPLHDLLGRLRQLPPRTIVLFANFRRDGNGQVFEPLDIIGSMARASTAPMYASLRGYLGEGIVGGSVVSFDEEGVRTGQLIVRVLRRRPRERMPAVEVISKSFVADWRQLRRWGLSVDRLPSGTEVLFREPTLWQQYRMGILLAFGLIGAQSFLVGGLLLERRKRKHAQLAVEEQTTYEQMLAKLTAEAAHHAPDDGTRALEGSLARVAAYAGASAATLVQYSEMPLEPPTRLFWVADPEREKGSPAPARSSNAPNDVRLDIPLSVDGTVIGRLELYRAGSEAWPPLLARRLDAAGELIASGMARSRAARTIRREEELNRSVLSSLSSPIAILDHHGTIVRVNEAWRDLARRAEVDASCDAFVGWNYLEECRRAEHRGCQEALDVRRGVEAVLKDQTSPFRYEYQASTPVERWYELFVDRLQLSDGGAIITHLDVTDRRIAERRAEEIRRQVAHMGRVALIGELAATISHELRQPLAAIRANAEAGSLLLRNRPPDLAEAREIFHNIVADDKRAVDVIEGVRKLLRKDEPVATTVDLNQICRDAIRLLQNDAVMRNTRLDLALAPAPTLVTGDPVQLQQVVLNLTLNALEATSSSKHNRVVTVSTALRADSVEVSVHDSGPGIPANVQAHLFEPFFSTKRGGLGLGLVIVRSIIERHSGRVRAESDSSGGAVFRVTLPTTSVRELTEVADQPPSAASRALPASPPSPRSNTLAD
jgi:signal transduction histidine kinase